MTWSIGSPETSATNYQSAWPLTVGPIDCPESSVRNYQSAWPLMMEPKGCTETSVTNYKTTLRNIQERRRKPEITQVRCGWQPGTESKKIRKTQELVTRCSSAHSVMNIKNGAVLRLWLQLLWIADIFLTHRPTAKTWTVYVHLPGR
jgi:hypothetical protein